MFSSEILRLETLLRSSEAERPAVNRDVVGSIPTVAACRNANQNGYREYGRMMGYAPIVFSYLTTNI